MKFIPQLELTDEEFDQLNAAAAEANMGMYDYVRFLLVGRAPPPRKPLRHASHQGEPWPPELEVKDGAELEGKAGKRRGGKVADTGAG